MAIHIADRADLDDQVKRLAKQLGLHGSSSETRASLDRFLKNGKKLRERILRENPNLKEPLSKTLQDMLYDERGLPK